MLKAAVPSPTATSTRVELPAVRKARQARGSRPALAATCARRVARLLLPQRDDVEHHRHERRALDDLDQPHLAEMREQHAEDQRARDHADQQHDVEQRDDARPRALGREVGRQRQPDGLRRVQAGADEQERQRRADLADQAGPWCRRRARSARTA